MADPSRQTPTEPWQEPRELQRLPPEPWRRFTLLDLFLIQLGFALGFSLAAILKPKEASVAFVLVVGSLFGAVACGPIVLWVQRALRGRWMPLSAGEWLWLLTSALYAPCLCCPANPAGIIPIRDALRSLGWLVPAPWFMAHGLCGLTALVLLLMRFDRRSPVACRWTYWAGVIVTLLDMPMTCLTSWLIEKGT